MVAGPGHGGDETFVRLALESAEGGRRRMLPSPPRCRLHVLVHGAVPGELGLGGCQFEVEVVHGERDDDDERQDEAQDKGQGLLQALPLVCDALVGCRRRNNTHSQVSSSRRLNVMSEFVCIVSVNLANLFIFHFSFS